MALRSSPILYPIRSEDGKPSNNPRGVGDPSPCSASLDSLLPPYTVCVHLFTVEVTYQQVTGVTRYILYLVIFKLVTIKDQ